MSENSKIEWTDHTFNPWIGCTKVSPGCAHCYAETLMDTRRGRAQWGKGKPRVRTVASTWNEPRKWNAKAPERRMQNGMVWTKSFALPDGRIDAFNSTGLHGCFDAIWWENMPMYRPRVFCASLCDVFDDEVPIEWLADLLALIDDCKNLDWQLLTKRPENIASRMNAAMHGNFEPECTFAEHMPHVWLGTSVENQRTANHRIPELLAIQCSVRFLSCEPLLDPVDLGIALEPWDECGNCGADFDYSPEREDVCPSCHKPNCMSTGFGTALRTEYQNAGGHVEVPDGPGIHWIICGGESGPGARPMAPSWARSLRDQATAAGVAFHFKQWGGVNKKAAGRELDGRTWDELPTPRKP